MTPHQQIRVKASQVCPVRCRAEGMGLSKAVKDTDAGFILVGYDTFDNICEAG